MEIRPVGDELFHADRQTDRQRERDGRAELTKPIGAFSDYASTAD